MAKYGKFVTLLVAVSLAVSMVALSGCSAPAPAPAPETSATPAASTADFKLVTPGQITVGSETSFPPFESMNGQTAEGFDVDLMNAIGADLGLKVVFLSEGFATLVPTLAAGGKFDVIASGMFINEDRLKSIDFTDPYGVANQAIVVKADSAFKTAADLAGKKIATQASTTGETWAKENIKGAIIVPVDSTAAQLAAVKAGNADAAINDAPVMGFYAKDAAQGIKIIVEAPTAEPYALGVAKDNTALKDAMNASLKKLVDSGKMEELYMKWFGRSMAK
jgi:ABC-type amino acid transport substrate-binding protein